MDIVNKIPLINDLKHLLDKVNGLPKYFLYQQSDPASPAVVFTDIKNNLEDLLQIRLVNQPVESGKIISPYKVVMPRQLKFEAVFIPYSEISSMDDFTNQMEQMINIMESYLYNNELLILKKKYPVIKQYNYLKIESLKRTTSLNSLNYVLYEIVMKQVGVYYAEYGKVTPSQANNPTNSSTVKT